MAKVKNVTTETYVQPDAVPTSKVAAAGISGSVSVLIIYIGSELGLDMPAEVAAAITTVMAFLAGYMVKDKRVVVKH